MAKSFFEAVLSRGGLAGGSFDIATGPANTGIIDILLSVGDGALTVDAPLVLESSGVLGANRALDISALEVDEAGVALGGRIFFLYVRNSDIGTFNIAVTAGTSVNGGPFSITEVGDWLFTHVSGGVWRAYRLTTSIAVSAMSFQVNFATADWAAGTANRITIVQSGIPAAGEVGPHGLAIASAYVVQVYRDLNDRLVNLTVEVDPITGDINIIKAPAAPSEDGRVIIVGL